MPAHPRAREILAALGLRFLEGEFGFFVEIARSTQKVTDAAGRSHAAQSQIYYLLTTELPLNRLHWLASDDTHVLIEGGPVEYFLFHSDGRAERLVLGRDFARGERPVVAVPANCWKALRLANGAPFALMANALAPAWAPDRVKVGADESFLARYTGAAPWATAEFLALLDGR